MQAELVARAQQGDREAFSALARGASARLYATAWLILHQPDRAEDAVQDALIEAWRDIRGLRDPDHLNAWLHRLLVRACYRHARAERQRRLTEIAVPESLGGPTADVARAVADRDEIERAFAPPIPHEVRTAIDDGLVLLTGIWYESHQAAPKVPSIMRDVRNYAWAGLYDPWTGITTEIASLTGAPITSGGPQAQAVRLAEGRVLLVAGWDSNDAESPEGVMGVFQPGS